MNKKSYILDGVTYSHGEKTLLHPLTHSFETGTLTAIVGPNGSGKSTLMHLLSGTLLPSHGTIFLNNHPLTSLRPHTMAKQFAVVSQDFQFNFPFSVFDAVLMGRHPYIPRFASPTQSDAEHVTNALQVMDITHLAARSVCDLSGGEKQRVVFARALAQATPILLLDEPTSSMDIRHSLTAMCELQRLARDARKTIIIVLHDLNHAATYCDRILVLQDGTLHSHGCPNDALTPKTLSSVFGVNAAVMRHPKNKNLIITYESKE